jgi:hypothetical protein
MAKLVENAIQKMEAMRPDSNQFRDQLGYVISMIGACNSLTHCGISKPRAAKVAILNIQKHAYKMFLRVFWSRNQIRMEELDTWFDQDPLKSLFMLRDDMPIIFRSLDVDEGGMGDECIMKVAHVPEPTKTSEIITESSKGQWSANQQDRSPRRISEGSRFPKKAEKCQACGGLHDIRSCELNVWERIRAIERRNLCKNCIEENCDADNCRYQCLCNTCKNDMGVIPHSTWLCLRTKGGQIKPEGRNESFDGGRGRSWNGSEQGQSSNNFSNKRNRSFTRDKKPSEQVSEKPKRPKDRDPDEESRMDSSIVAAAIMQLIREQAAKEEKSAPEPETEEPDSKND